jgi:hypothetical protein
MTWGILAALVEQFQLPLVQQSPQGIKKALCGKMSASKEDVRDALIARYPGAFDPFMEEYPATQWEHGFDAASALVATLDSDVLRAVRGLAPCGG